VEARKLSGNGGSHPQVLSLRVTLENAVGLVAAARHCRSEQDDAKALHLSVQ
jgi:hypothetical protein